MRLEKKLVVKEDGRYLLYYHFPETATAEQSEVFAALPASAPESAGNRAPADASAPGRADGGEPRV